MTLVVLSKHILNLLWYPPCVSMVTGLCAEWSAVSILAGARNFSPLQNVHTSSGSPSLLFNGYLGFFLGHKQLGCEAGHLTPPGAEVNEWNSPYMPYWHTEGQLYCMHHV